MVPCSALVAPLEAVLVSYELEVVDDEEPDVERKVGVVLLTDTLLEMEEFKAVMLLNIGAETVALTLALVVVYMLKTVELCSSTEIGVDATCISPKKV